MVQERYLTKRTEVFDLRHPSESGHYGNRELLDAKKMAVPEFSFRRISQLPPTTETYRYERGAINLHQGFGYFR